MIQLLIGRSRSGALLVTAETTFAGEPYVQPPVTRTTFEFGIGESVSEVFAQLGEWCANELERQAHAGARNSADELTAEAQKLGMYEPTEMGT